MGLISELREVKPEIAVTSDVMVGFPGESREDFEMTLNLVTKVQFDALFSFKYSDRKGTFAEKMRGKVDEPEKGLEAGRTPGRSEKISLKKNRLLEGKQINILVEGESKRGGQLTGRSGSNKVVNFKCNNKKIGELVNVKIKHSFLNSLHGELV